MKIKITGYTHSIILACIGIFFIGFDSILSSIIGGVCIGTSLWWARKSGENEIKSS